MSSRRPRRSSISPQTSGSSRPVGGVLIFSAAQLHSTVPNTTDRTRFSIDFRTVNIDDLESGNAARNVDSECTGTTLGDFVRASDLEPLPDDLIDRYRAGAARALALDAVGLRRQRLVPIDCAPEPLVEGGRRRPAEESPRMLGVDADLLLEGPFSDRPVDRPGGAAADRSRTTRRLREQA